MLRRVAFSHRRLTIDKLTVRIGWDLTLSLLHGEKLTAKITTVTEESIDIIEIVRMRETQKRNESKAECQCVPRLQKNFVVISAI